MSDPAITLRYHDFFRIDGKLKPLGKAIIRGNDDAEKARIAASGDLGVSQGIDLATTEGIRNEPQCMRPEPKHPSQHSDSIDTGQQDKHSTDAPSMAASGGVD